MHCCFVYMTMINCETLIDFIGFKAYNILKDHEMLWILCKLFYDVYVARLRADDVPPWHRYYISGHEPGVRVMTFFKNKGLHSSYHYTNPRHNHENTKFF